VRTIDSVMRRPTSFLSLVADGQAQTERLGRLRPRGHEAKVSAVDNASWNEQLVVFLSGGLRS
jgi:hypothetical protein